ncbi:4-coumarate--CoA ligase family protein [Tsukamurella soli]|uniref:4-coumarate--CoA ligase family protein n=1 Tax=Tsukamurella soli TaxID=644556 RepID=A0ABP8JWE7_9ACTN
MTITSTYPDVDIPDVGVYDYLFAGLRPDELIAVAIIDGERSLTYGELQAAVNAFAGALAALGVTPGDVVALHAPNGIGFAVAFHGILRAGATVTTVNALYSPHEIANQLRDSRASAYITISSLLPAALAGTEEAGLSTDAFIVLDAVEGYPSLTELLAAGEPAPQVDLDPKTHLAVLPYSSGTTGLPKGVMLTHTNLVANIAQCTPALKVSPDDAVIAVLPFFHIYGMNVLLNLTLRNRGTLVTLPKFDLVEFLTTIRDRRITYAFIAPPVAVALAKHPIVDSYDLSSLRVVVSGAAPLDETLGEALVQRLGIRLLQGFGMTELSPVSHVTPFDDPHVSVGSIGTAIPNIEFKIVDPDTGDEITWTPGEPSAPGEMLVRGPNVMQGYLGNPEATTSTIEPDGFLHTGDIVVVGPQGEAYVVDRLKELIKYKGYQVPPAELEAVLLTHPAIADAAVVAHPDEEAGELPRAFVVLQHGASLSAAEVIDYVADRVAPHKKVRIVDFIDTVPKSVSGKILRKDLKGRRRVAPSP